MVEGNSLQPTDPAVVGPWHIESRIGAGGMGVVYRASRGDRVAAIKVIRPGLLDDVATQTRFAREVQVLSGVRDVHISEFLDADLTSEPAWLATSFIAGANLREAVATGGPVDEAEWWQLARGLAQALAVLELHGITHRDIKPANVILAQHGPVLIDFGIALPSDATSLTAAGLVTGSAAWLSPEQADLKPATAASDVFSLGSLLAFAATGRPPFGQGAHVAVLAAISTKDPDLDGLTSMQANLVTSMLAKDPQERPTAREILAWVKRVQDATEASPAPTPVIPAPSPPAPSRPAPSPPAPHVAPASAPQHGTGPKPEPAPAPKAEPQNGRVPEPRLNQQVESTTTDNVIPVPAATTAPTSRRSPESRALWAVGAIVLVLLAAVGVWMVRPGGADSPAGGVNSESASPAPVESSPSASAKDADIPPAPEQDVLTSGGWGLTNYRITNDGGVLGVAGSVRNNTDAKASATMTIYVYVDGQFIGTVSAPLKDVPAGGTTEVEFTGTDEWRAGAQTLRVAVSAL